MNKNICPACGSENIKKNKRVKYIEMPFGGKKSTEIIEYECNTCGTSGDFFNKNEEHLQKIISELKNESISNILNNFTDNHISLASIERALDIPQRTLTKWKNKTVNPSSTGIALFRFLRLFPWLLEVAENKYNYVKAQKIQMKSAFNKMLESMSFNQTDFVKAGIVTTSNQLYLYLQYEQNIASSQNTQTIVNNDNMQIIDNKPSIEYLT
ncbi:MAG: hypothetical protein KAT05_01430 [Spirochaetes bacterium]|nr:hypothetical protein [Spirochaetota bacterium]